MKLNNQPKVYAQGMIQIDQSERIVGQWYSYNKGKAWSKYDPEVEALVAEVHRRREREYLYACYIYYHYKGDEVIESPLSDSDFDCLQNTLDLSRDNWSEYFRGKIGNIKKGFMKAEAFMITFTDEEKQAAIKWAKGVSNGLSKGLSNKE